MKTTQLEINFETPKPRPHVRRMRRSSRAKWWFDQMRRVVSAARDWSVPTPAPEQTCFGWLAETTGRAR